MAIGTNWAEIWAPVWGPVWQGSAPQVTVPDVVGQTQASATAELEGEGFAVAVNTAYSSTVAAGDVISQSPAAGVETSEGATVTITVSLGEAPVEEGGGGWAFFLKYQEERDRRRQKRQEQAEDKKAVEQLPPVEKEIAQILHKQERIDEHKADLARLKALVEEYRAVPALSPKASEAFERALVRGLRSDLTKLDKALEKELKRMLEDEEEQVLQLLIKAWDEGNG